MSTPPTLSVVARSADNPAAHTAQPLRRVRAGTGQPGPQQLSPLSKNIETLVEDAYDFGVAYGQRQGYTCGWRYGVVCGCIATAMAAALMALAAGWIA